MVFFRSEEHLKKWDRFGPENEQGIITLHDLHKLFSLDLFRRRLDPDYPAKMKSYIGEVIATFKALGKTGPYWVP